MQNFRKYDLKKIRSYDCPELHDSIYIGLKNEINSCMMCRGQFDYKNLQIDHIDSVNKENACEKNRKIIEHQNTILKRMYLGDVPEFCKGCYHLRVKNNDIPYQCSNKLKYISLCGAKTCNLKCKHCFFTQDNSGIENTDVIQIQKFIETFKRQGLLDSLKSIRLANGEPSIIKEDLALADFFIRNKIKAEIFSNGVVYQEVFAKGVNLDLFRVILSPDAGSREVYCKIKGRDFFEKTWRTIKQYEDSTNSNVEVKFIIEEGNYADVDNMISMCVKCGVRKVHLSMDVTIPESEFKKYVGPLNRFVELCRLNSIELLSIYSLVPAKLIKND